MTKATASLTLQSYVMVLKTFKNILFEIIWKTILVRSQEMQII